MAEKQTSFEKLYGINVNDKTESKNGLTYLSWAWAWSEFKKVHPDASYEVKKFENGLPYAYDPNTGYMVYTTVTVDGLTHEMWLPVMDGNNKAMKAEPYKVKTKYKEIPVQAATMFDVNKAIMRCLTKNLAMFGLGLYIYSGEDLPETAEEEVVESKPKKAQPKKADTPSGEDVKKMLNKSEDELRGELKHLLMETDSDVTAFLAWASKRYKREIANVDVMVGSELEDAIAITSRKKGDK